MADELARLINSAVTEGAEGAWRRLMRFAYTALRVKEQSREAPRRSLAAKVRLNLTQNGDPDGAQPSVPPTKRRRGHRPADEVTAMSRRVASKLTDGDIRGALRTLTSDDSYAPPADDVINKMQEKHPKPPVDLRDIPPPDDSQAPLVASEADVMKAINSFPPSSSAGLDGIRPAHLRSLLTKHTAEAGARLLTALTALTNLALSGRLPECVVPAFFGASLIALRKKDGGLRPIAVGSVYRRIAGKVAAAAVSGAIGARLRPIQLGVATRNGCEAAVHAVRAYIQGSSESAADSKIMVKLDVSNAFNTVRRDSMMEAVIEQAPAIYPFVWQGYNTTTPLFIGDSKILSQTGIQQGDPLSSLLFSLTVDAAARSADTDINIWYLDDGTLAGSVPDVVSSIQRVRAELSKVGLTINPTKCEAILLEGSSEESKSIALRHLHSVLPDIREVAMNELELLGAPVHDDQVRRKLLQGQLMMEKLIRRLQALEEAHQAFFLLKSYVSLPRVLYLLRSSPAYRHPALLVKIDETVRCGMEAITNVRLRGDSWRQATLPVNLGGLGVRMVTDVALPAHIASQVASADTIASINGSAAARVGGATRCLVEEWEARTGLPSPDVSRQRYQRDWDRAAAEAIGRQLLDDCTTDVDRARLRAAAQPHSGAWLNAFPAASVGTLLDPDTLRTAVALRVGAEVCAPHRCRCGADIDERGLHGLSCQLSAGRFPRHAELNSVIKRGLAAAGLPSVLEPAGLDRGDGRRPDGITAFPYAEGKCLVWDATCVDTFSASSVAASAARASAAATAAEGRKRRRYEAISRRYLFRPVAVETSGALGSDSCSFLKDLGRRIVQVTGDRRDMERLIQRISVAVVRGNATAIRLAGAHDRPDVRTAVTSFDRSGGDSRGNSHNVDRCSRSSCGESRDECGGGSGRGSGGDGGDRSAGEISDGCDSTGEGNCSVGCSKDSATALRPGPVMPVRPSAGSRSEEPSRNILDDPDLAYYLLPRRESPPLTDADSPTTQQLAEQLLCLSPSSAQDTPRPPRPNALTAYVALLAEMRESIRDHGAAPEPL